MPQDHRQSGGDSESSAVEAMRAGYSALLAGDGPSANPHRMSLERAECIAWGRGWAAARTDLKRENAKLA